jgi:hypothetical protein
MATLLRVLVAIDACSAPLAEWSTTANTNKSHAFMAPGCSLFVDCFRNGNMHGILNVTMVDDAISFCCNVRMLSEDTFLDCTLLDACSEGRAILHGDIIQGNMVLALPFNVLSYDMQAPSLSQLPVTWTSVAPAPTPSTRVPSTTDLLVCFSSHRGLDRHDRIIYGQHPVAMTKLGSLYEEYYGSS